MKIPDEDEILRSAGELRWEQPERAIGVLKEFLARYPQSTRVKLLLASIYADEYGEDVPGAERLYREVLADDPKNVAVLCGLALLHGHPNSTVTKEESLKLLRQATDHSEDPNILLNLANKAWDVGQFKEALSSFDRLLFIAKSRRQLHLVRLSRSAIKAIRRGERPASVQYSWPEVE